MKLSNNIHIKLIKISNKISCDYDICGFLNLSNCTLCFDKSKTSTETKIILDINEFAKNTKSLYYAFAENGVKYTLYNLVSVKQTEKECIYYFDTIFENGSIDPDKIIYGDTANLLLFYPRNKGVLENLSTFVLPCSDIKCCEREYDARITISEINMNDDAPYVKLSVFSSNQKYLGKTAEYILELFYLYLGTMPEMIKVVIPNHDDYVYGHFNVSSKYKFKEIFFPKTKLVLQAINERTLTADVFKNFINFRNQSYVEFDAFLAAMNSIDFNDLSVSMLLQSIEGIKKTLMCDATKGGKDERLWSVLKYCFDTLNLKNNLFKWEYMNFKETKESKENKCAPFIYYLVQFRDYYSHYFNEKYFKINNIPNDYCSFLKTKLSVCTRVLFFHYLNINYDEDLLNSLAENIDEKIEYAISESKN